jgi:2'-5' RNA ligase
VDEERVEKIKDVIASAAEKRGAIELRLGEIGFFPPPSKKGGEMADKIRPRVIFIETKEEDKVLEELRRDFGMELEKLGMEIDKRAWRPHITLARLECPIETAIFEKIKIKPLEFKIKSVELMESHLKRSGAEYETVKSFGLN